MKREALVHFQHVDLTLLAMILFGLVFVGAIAHTLRRSRRAHYVDLSRLPLEEEIHEFR